MTELDLVKEAFLDLVVKENADVSWHSILWVLEPLVVSVTAPLGQPNQRTLYVLRKVVLQGKHLSLAAAYYNPIYGFLETTQYATKFDLSTDEGVDWLYQHWLQMDDACQLLGVFPSMDDRRRCLSLRELLSVREVFCQHSLQSGD